eukprot:scaffold51224_cov17-Tisochrysis_lutea.AAC.1
MHTITADAKEEFVTKCILQLLLRDDGAGLGKGRQIAGRMIVLVRAWARVMVRAWARADRLLGASLTATPVAGSNTRGSLSAATCTWMRSFGKANSSPPRMWSSFGPPPALQSMVFNMQAL